MEKLDLGYMGLKNMSTSDMIEVECGWVLPFIAGAIIGGMIYDVYKAASLAMIQVQIDHPEYYDGAVHSQR